MGAKKGESIKSFIEKKKVEKLTPFKKTHAKYKGKVKLFRSDSEFGFIDSPDDLTQIPPLRGHSIDDKRGHKVIRPSNYVKSLSTNLNIKTKELLRSKNSKKKKLALNYKPKIRENQVSLHITEDLNSDSVQNNFRFLAENWYLETLHSSGYLDKILHPAYQRIIGLGKDVIPFIVRELQDEPSEWFWALRALTGEDPTTKEMAGNREKLAEAWLNWGKENGYI
jgi:hypothetical protein